MRNKITFFWLSAFVAAGVFLAIHLNVVTDLRQFIPGKTGDDKIAVLLRQAGKNNNLVFVQLHGENSQEIAIAGKRLKKILQKNNIFVANGQQDFRLGDYQDLMKHRYPLNESNDFSATALHKNFKDVIRAFRNGATTEMVNYLLRDPQKSLLRYLKVFSKNKIQKKHGIWFIDEKTAFLILKSDNITFIKDRLKTLVDKHNVTFDLSGPSVIASEVRHDMETTMWWLSWILSAVVFILFLVFYRSLKLLLFAFLPLFLSIILTTAIVQALFGSVHSIVLAFGVTSLGICLDYPLHLFSHLKKGESARQSLGAVWQPLKLGALTSIFAYLSLIGTGFTGLTQLAIFCAVGLLIALFVTKTLLPQWIQGAWAQNRRSVPVWRPLRLRSKFFFAAVTVFLPMGFLLSQNNILSKNIRDINPATTEQLQTEQTLRTALHIDTTDFLLFEGKNVETVLMKTHKIQPFLQTAKTQSIISGFRLATDILPAQAVQKQRQSLLPDRTALEKTVRKVGENLKFKKGAFTLFIDDVVHSELVDYEKINAMLPNTNLKSLLFQHDKRWYSLIGMDVQDENAFRSWLKTTPNADKNYISTKNNGNQLMRDYLTAAWQRLLLVLGMMSLVVFWQMRRRPHKFWILAPIFSGVFVTLLFQTVLGNPITIFHVLSLLLVVGLGFDYGLFFNQTWKTAQEFERRAHAITISAISTVSIFSVLGLSRVAILAGMGQIIAVGVLTCFIVAGLICVPQRRNIETA